MSTTYPWTEFFILWGLGVMGAVLVMPYALTMNPALKTQVKLPLPALVAIGTLQNAVLLALATGLGLLAARASGMGAPIIEAALRSEPILSALRQMALPAVGLGLLAGVLIVALDLRVFMARLPQEVRDQVHTPGALKGFLASFYGGISEELLMRLFVLSSLAWLLGRFWQAPDGLPAAGAVISSIVLAALIFGAGHLPATAALTPLTPIIVTRALLLNGLAGVIFGLLYWRFGLEAAMLGHFTADLVLHVIAPLLPAAATQPA